MPTGAITLPCDGTDRDSSANIAAFSDHNLTTWEAGRAVRAKAIAAECDATLAVLTADWSARPSKAAAPPVITGTIYFVGPNDGPIKIGFASRLALRLKDLRTMNPYPLIVHATTDGHPKVERQYHKKFAAHRLHGEWFSPHPDILAEIERLNSHPRLAGEV